MTGESASEEAAGLSERCAALFWFLQLVVLGKVQEKERERVGNLPNIRSMCRQIGQNRRRKSVGIIRTDIYRIVIPGNITRLIT